jgi:pyruvate formate lyase activating enzyme
MKHRGIWVEVTTLIIPTLNDDEGELREIAEFVRSLGEEVPWHVSRFHPRYRIQDLSPTPVKSIQRAMEIGQAAGLKYVYSGNVSGQGGESTQCGTCGNLLIGRQGYFITANNLKGSKCSRCGTVLAGIFSDR